jgi:hypothetical protein
LVHCAPETVSGIGPAAGASRGRFTSAGVNRSVSAATRRMSGCTASTPAIFSVLPGAGDFSRRLTLDAMSLRGASLFRANRQSTT